MRFPTLKLWDNRQNPFYGLDCRQSALHGCALTFPGTTNSASCSLTALLPAWRVDAASEQNTMALSGYYSISCASFSWRAASLLIPFLWLPPCLSNAFSSWTFQNRSSDTLLLLSHCPTLPILLSHRFHRRVQLTLVLHLLALLRGTSGSPLTNSGGLGSYLAFLSITFLLSRWWL